MGAATRSTGLVPSPPNAGAGCRALLELCGVRKTYAGGVEAVAGIDLEIRDGEFVSLLGPSGSGKTTTLRMIAGFEQPNGGEIVLDGQRLDLLPPNRRPVNTVFQDYALFPHLSVRDNVGFGLRATSRPRHEVAERANEGLALVDLTSLADRRPNQLSGGQRQRVALARALVMRPRVLLLDEPLGALDLKLRRRMQLVLMDLCRGLGTTFVYVTHDQDEALTMSDRVAVMADGHIEQFASPRSLYDEPATAFVAGFVGESNMIAGRLGRRDGAHTFVELAGRLLQGIGSGLSGVGSGSPVTLAIRPEAVRVELTDRDGAIPARVIRSVFVAGEARVFARLTGGEQLQVRLGPAEAAHLAEEQEIWLTWHPDAGRVFPR